MKIVEGLHVEEVGHMKKNVFRRSRTLMYNYVTDKKERSILWQPHGDNWLAGEVMRVLLKGEEHG